MALFAMIAAVDGEAQSAAMERPAFVDVLHEHQGMVFSIALHFLRDRSAAEEVAQDVFLQLHKHFDSIEVPRVVFWLRKVTSHRAIDYIRRRKLRTTVALENLPEPSSPGEQPDLMLNRRLRTLVASLPEKPRMVMVLRYQEDMMPEEIAAALDMPVRTVKSHLHRSLEMLREKIGRSMGEMK
jgi:RNA polymerase sigma-70 factor (ECF subfamily)